MYEKLSDLTSVFVYTHCINHFYTGTFPGAPIDNELLKKVIDVHDPNRTDSIDYSVFLTGKKFVNKVITVKHSVIERYYLCKNNTILTFVYSNSSAVPGWRSQGKLV